MRLQKGFLGDEEGGRGEKTSGSWMPPTLVRGWRGWGMKRVGILLLIFTLILLSGCTSQKTYEKTYDISSNVSALKVGDSVTNGELTVTLKHVNRDRSNFREIYLIVNLINWGSVPQQYSNPVYREPMMKTNYWKNDTFIVIDNKCQSYEPEMILRHSGGNWDSITSLVYIIPEESKDLRFVINFENDGKKAIYELGDVNTTETYKS